MSTVRTYLHREAGAIITDPSGKREVIKLIRRYCGCNGSGGGGSSSDWDIIQFTIGDGGGLTPIAGETEYTNPALDDRNIYVNLNGFGFLVEGEHFDVLPGGGIELLGGYVFDDETTYTIFAQDV